MDILIVLLLFVLYFLPTILAAKNQKRSYTAIAAMNLLLGWTGLAWLVALFWALTKDPQPTVVNVHYDREREVTK